MPPFPSTQSYILHNARRRGVWSRVIAAGVLVGAVALCMALGAYLGDSASFAALFVGVTIAVWMIGSRVAVVFALFGYLACHYLFVDPRHGLSFGDARTVAGMVAYALTCGLIVAIGEAMRSAQDRAHSRGELLRVALAGIADAVIATDIESRITYLNESAEMLTGWSCVEALGHPLNTVFRLTPGNGDDSTVTEAMQAPCAEEATESARRAVLLGRDAVARPIEHSAAPIKDRDGLIAGCAVTFRDIAEKQRFTTYQSAVAQRERLLLREVAAANERSRVLEEEVRMLSANLSEADRRRNVFLATLARALRDALVPLCNALEIVRRAGSDRSVTATAIDAIDALDRQTAQIVRLVDDLRDLSCISRDGPELRKDDEMPISASARAPTPSRRVLVVDDDHSCAASLARLLKLDGHPTFIAHSGAAALEAAEKHRPDVVFLDIGMPVMDGCEVCRRLRERPYGKDIIIIALTAWGRDSDRRKTHEAGFDGHFVKPANYDALAALLQSGAPRDCNKGSAADSAARTNP